MFCRNDIEGLLKGIAKSRDGDEEMFYDISSKQNLLRIYERKEFGFDEVKELFYSWRDVTNEAERYLLNPVFLLCSPEFLYFDLSEKKYCWVFYPTDAQQNLPEGLSELSEFLLEKVNRRDFDAMDVIYRFHHDVKEGNFYLKEIIKTIEEIKVRDLEGEDVLETEEYLNQEMLHSENEEFAETAEEEEDFGERFLRKIGKIFAGRKKKTDSRAEGKEEGGKEKKQNHEQIREEVSEVPKHDLPGGITWMEEEYEDTSRTVMMGRKEEVRILTSVSDGRSYSLEKLPVLVGKPGQDVDIVLESPSVSRLHARFYEEGGKVFLEDLNSTNGCTLNLIPLQANERVELASGDRIRIGDVEFIYGKADR